MGTVPCIPEWAQVLDRQWVSLTRWLSDLWHYVGALRRVLVTCLSPLLGQQTSA